MKREYPFTDTQAFAKYPNRLEAFQVWYYSYFTFVERSLEPVMHICDAPEENSAADKLKAIRSTIKFVLRAVNKMATAVRLDLSSIKVEKDSFELGKWIEGLGAISTLQMI